MWRDRINRPEPDPADPSPAFRNGIFGTFDEEFVSGTGDIGTSDARVFAMMDAVLEFTGANDTEVADPGLPPDDDAFADLEHIDLFAGNDATLEINNAGGDRFMANLQSIRVQALGNAAVSISNSRARDETNTKIDDGGNDFMPALQTIEIENLEADSGASLSLSTSGEPGFLASVRSISVIGHTRVDVSLSASANFPGATGAGFLDALETLTVISHSDNATLSITHSGSDNFMASLRQIFVQTGADPDSTDGDPAAELSISASANTVGGGGEQLLGENFMPMLETITVISNLGDASLSISHSGGDMFMPKLRHMHVESGGDDASISISASSPVSRHEDLRGDNFMIGLETITVIAADNDASLSLSHDGGANFMAGLKKILVQGGGTSSHDISVSASAHFTGMTGSKVVLPGDDYMKSLETIEVLGTQGRVSLSVSHDGGANFMQNLKTILLHSLGVPEGDDGTVDVSFSASASITGTGALTTQLRGDDFMGMLETITLIGSTENRVSVSVSHDGGDRFMENLRSVLVHNQFTGTGEGGDREADFDISASINFTGATAESFMASLETLTVLSDRGFAEVSLSSDGAHSFLASLHTMLVEGGSKSHIALKNHAGDDFMPSLREIDLFGGTDTDLGPSFFDLDLLGQSSEGAVSLLLRNVLRDSTVTEGHIPFVGTPTAGDNFMTGLERIKLESGRDAGLVIQNGSLVDGVVSQQHDVNAAEGHPGGTNFLPLVDNIMVHAALGISSSIKIEGDNSLGSLRFIDFKANQADDFEGLLEFLDSFDFDGMTPFDATIVDSTGVSLEVDGNDFDNVLPQLQDIRVMSNGLSMEDDIGHVSVDVRDFMSRKFDVTLSTNELGEIDFDAHDTPGLREVSLSGEDVATVDISGVQTCFKELDLSGMAAESMTTATMNAGGTLFGDSFDVRIGSGDLDYTAAAVGEQFIFTATDIGGADGMDVDITGFSTAAPGAGGDVIDLSLLGVAGLGELMVDDAGADVVITSTDADFTGEITLVGIATAASVTDDNFIFT